MLYRLFGDKDGLLSAVVDHVWDQYLSMKRTAVQSPDPLDDLYAGWDSHISFALDHPHAYRLLFGSTLSTPPEAAAEAMRLLRVNLDRLAEQGRLRVPPEEASRVVMAANSGVALALLLRPDQYPDRSISALLREAVYRTVLAEHAEPTVAAQASIVAATTLRSQLANATTQSLFTPAETGLFDEWLRRIQSRDQAT